MISRAFQKRYRHLAGRFHRLRLSKTHCFDCSSVSGFSKDLLNEPRTNITGCLPRRNIKKKISRLSEVDPRARDTLGDRRFTLAAVYMSVWHPLTPYS